MHSCPICDQACYCGGDIEDHDTEDGAMFCEHCDDLDVDGEPDDDE